MNIIKVIEFLNHCEGKAKISLNNKSKIQFSKKNETDKVRRESIAQFEKILKNWELFKKLNLQDKAYLIENLEDLKGQNKSLTANKIRQVYRQVIEGNYDHFDPLSKIQWVSSQGSLEDRIIVTKKQDTLDTKIENIWFETWRSSKLDENRDSIRRYRAELNKKWGADRVARALTRSSVDFDQMIKEGSTLTVLHTRMITMSLLDTHQADLQDTYRQILDFTEGKGPLSDLQRESLKRELFIKSDTALKTALKKRFPKRQPIETLSSLKYSFLMSLTRPSHEEITTAFFGKPIEGIISGHQDDNFYRFWFSYSKDLQERLQLNETILKLNERVPANQVEQAYDEILTKALAKKAVHEGMLIPSPSGQWYRVEKRIFTKKSKLSYYLKPVSNDSNLPDRLVYRSTASNPSNIDSFTTIVTDAYPFEPPGYLWGKEGFRDELDIVFNSNNELKVIGHSLGGSHAQILMINLMEHMKKKGIHLGKKKLTFVCFDSPAIKEKDARRFKKWASQSDDAKNVRFDYYFSKPDIVPGAGDLHLGHGTHGTLVKVNYHMLDAIDERLPELKINAHGRFYFLTRAGIDFNIQRGDVRDLEKFDAEDWRQKIEWMRTAAGVIVAPLVGIPGFLKRVFIQDTREDPEPLINKALA